MRQFVLVGILLAQAYGGFYGYTTNRPRQATNCFHFPPARQGTITNPFHVIRPDGRETEVWALDPGPTGPAMGSVINPFQIEE